jgi:cytochrome bd-type quinol oxidase subunit 2
MLQGYPKLIDRVQSTLIDTVFIVVLSLAFANILEKFDIVQVNVKIIIFAGIVIGYEPLCITFGTTLGNYIKGIRVRKNADPTKRINILQAFIRYPIKLLLGWVSFLTIGANAKRRAIHDIVSGSVMIKL